MYKGTKTHVIRTCVFFHFHDSCGRRREKSSCAQVPRRLSACTESQFHALACYSVLELQRGSFTVSDSKYGLLAQNVLLTRLQPFVSTVGIFWTAYLSVTNSSDEPLDV